MKNLTKLTALTLTAALALTACGSSTAATAPGTRQTNCMMLPRKKTARSSACRTFV